LWPSWPSEPVALDVPALPITVAGMLFGILRTSRILLV
jgi:hypothetical protein